MTENSEKLFFIKKLQEKIRENHLGWETIQIG